MMLEFLTMITKFVNKAGYLGILFMTFLESTFVPLPAEITMVPAGYLIAKGQLKMIGVLSFSIIGMLLGSWLNYWIAAKYGKGLILKFGKYFFMNEKKLNQLNTYFNSHGPIATFTGRLIPGLRHYISFPAGLAGMNLRLFFLYTFLGGGIWMLTLTILGYLIGEQEELIKEYLVLIQIIFAALIILLISIYLLRLKFNKLKK